MFWKEVDVLLSLSAEYIVDELFLVVVCGKRQHLVRAIGAAIAELDCRCQGCPKKSAKLLICSKRTCCPYGGSKLT